MQNSATLPRMSRGLPDAPSAEGASLLFAIRLWASVCLALLVAFWLELDNPYWAGASATVVCQLQLGASLRKGWFRMIGTVAGAVVIVVLTAWVPQDRIAYLGLLALWGGLCAFAATPSATSHRTERRSPAIRRESSPPIISARPVEGVPMSSCWQSGA